MLVFYLVASLVRKVQYRRCRAQEELFQLVNQVAEIVHGCSTGWVPIQHVRDHIFLPQERINKKKLWDSAVDFIEKHESRVSGLKTDIALNYFALRFIVHSLCYTSLLNTVQYIQYIGKDNCNILFKFKVTYFM